MKETGFPNLLRSALFLGNSQICPRRPCEAGSHQAAICYRNTGIAPLRRSDRAAQCSDAFKAGVSLFLLTVIAVPVAIRHLQQVLPLASLLEGRRAPDCHGSRFRASSEVTYLMKCLFNFQGTLRGKRNPLTIHTKNRGFVEVLSQDFFRFSMIFFRAASMQSKTARTLTRSL